MNSVSQAGLETKGRCPPAPPCEALRLAASSVRFRVAPASGSR